jgi:hypothetical protein
MTDERFEMVAARLVKVAWAPASQLARDLDVHATEFENCDKWRFCLNLAMVPGNRRDDN